MIIAADLRTTPGAGASLLTQHGLHEAPSTSAVQSAGALDVCSALSEAPGPASQE